MEVKIALDNARMKEEYMKRGTILRLAVCSGILGLTCAASGVVPVKLLQEDFESSLTSYKYKQETNCSCGKFNIVSPGQLSKTCLLADKPDTCGFIVYRIPFAVPAESRGHWMQLSADLKTDYVGPEAEYYFMVTQLENGKSNGDNAFLAFNDGISRQSGFGGAYKTPQTAGEWKKTIHQMQLRNGTDRIELALVVSGGEQKICFDNILVNDIGREKLPAAPPLVFEKSIDWPYAMIELENLLPGCVYRIETEVSWPFPGKSAGRSLTPNSSNSPLQAPADMAGMGVAMTASDLFGRKAIPEQLLDSVPGKDKRNYRLVVPQNAVKVLLDFHNDDLIRFDHNQIEQQARRWQTVRIYLENYGEIAADNAYWQYIYRQKSQSLKPRNFLELSKFDIDVLKETLKARKEAELKVVKYNNGMCFMLNGKPIPPIIASSFQTDYLEYDNLGAEGIKVLFARTPHGCAPMHGDWEAENKYNFNDLDINIYNTLYQNPDATVILSVDSVYPPTWWGKDNPDELMKDQDGNFVWDASYLMYVLHFGKLEQLLKLHEAQSGDSNNIFRMRGARWAGHLVPSPASDKYRKIMVDYLTAMRHHIEQQPYGKAIVGYRLLWGYDGQWNPPGDSFDNNGKVIHCVDFSVPMRNKFRKFLENKYKSEEGLRKAWNDNNITFATVQIPGVELRNFDQMSTPTPSYLLDPGKYPRMIDYRECSAENTADLLLTLCHAIKNAGPRPVMTLAYYPDIIEGCGDHATYKVYDSEDFNAAGGPSYDAREIGQAGRTNCLLNSLTLHNKIHLNELDHRVFPVAKRNYANNLLFDSPTKSISILRREYMRQMCFGTGSWTLDMGLAWFNDPLIAAIIGNANCVFGKILEYDRSSIAGMAIFIGDYSKTIQADVQRGAIPKELMTSPVIAAAHAGVPIDQYIMHDLPLVENKYKVFFFPLAYGLTAQEIQNIERLKCNGNILVFGFGAGYVSDSVSLENVEKLTGFKLNIDPALSLTVKIENNGHPVTRNLGGHFMGSAGNAGYETGLPRIFVNDPEAVVLGNFINSTKAGFAVKDHGSWKGIYMGSIGNVPPELLRNIAAWGGLHIYNDANDVMFFNKSLVAIHASSSGIKKIKLPRPAKVTSMWDNLKAGKVSVIERPMKGPDGV